MYVSGGSTDNYTLTGLRSGEVYNISIVGTSEHFFSESVVWDTVNLTIPGELIKPVRWKFITIQNGMLTGLHVEEEK